MDEKDKGQSREATGCAGGYGKIAGTQTGGRPINPSRQGIAHEGILTSTHEGVKETAGGSEKKILKIITFFLTNLKFRIYYK